MTLSNTAALLTQRRGFPNIAGLHLRHEAESPLNSLTVGDTFIDQAEDLSGNGRHATAAGNGMGFEVSGSSQGKACWKNTNAPLTWATTLTTSKYSIFFIMQGTTLQVVNSEIGGQSIVAATFAVDANSPAMINNAGANVAIGDFNALTDWDDEVMRAFTWVYDDTTNIRKFYEGAVLVQDSGDWAAGTAAGAFDFVLLGRDGGKADNRTSAVVFYEGILLTQQNIQDLYGHYQTEGVVL